jgi:hypothetical protein
MGRYSESRLLHSVRLLRGSDQWRVPKDESFDESMSCQKGSGQDAKKNKNVNFNEMMEDDV